MHDGGHGADLLADLVVEGIHHAGDLLIVLGLRQQIAHIVGAGVGHQTAAAGEHAVHLAFGVLAGEALLHQLTGGQGAGALGREGTLAVQRVLGVHHAALHVSADGNAAAHVADDEVQLLILLALLLGEALGHGLLVQSVENADALEQGVAGIAGHVCHFIDDHRVDDVGGDAQLVADLAGDQAAQIGGVLSLHADGAVLDHVVVDSVCTAANGAQQTAAAGDGGEGAGVEALLAQRLHYQVAAPVLLGGDSVELGDLLRTVAQGLVEEKLLILIHTDLGGGGAGIDYKNSVRHVCFPPMLFCSAAQRVKSTFLIIQNMMPSVNGFLRKNAVFYIRG